MSAWQYDRIKHALDALEEAKRLFPASTEDANSKTLPPHPIRADGTGPQF